MAINEQDSLRITRLRGNAEAADVVARMRREQAEIAGARPMTASNQRRYELELAIADAAREQAELSRAKLIQAVARDPAYLAFLETYTYGRYLADGKIGPLAAYRAHGAAA